MSEQPRRPQPSINADNEWFWDGCRARELRIQTFRDATCVYPPMVRNPRTGEMPATPEWQVASGQATLYSFAVPHHPQVPGFEYPLFVGLVELDEGVRIVSNIVECERDELLVGMALELCWLDAADDVVLPQFRPAGVLKSTDTATRS